MPDDERVALQRSLRRAPLKPFLVTTFMLSVLALGTVLLMH